MQVRSATSRSPRRRLSRRSDGDAFVLQENRLIAALPLCPVKRLIGSTNQFLCGRLHSRHGTGDTKTGRKDELTFYQLDGILAQRIPQAFCLAEGAGIVAPGQNDQEFFASIAAD